MRPAIRSPPRWISRCARAVTRARLPSCWTASSPPAARFSVDSAGQHGSVARLRKVDCSGPGLRRRRRGNGFEVLDEDGNRVTDAEVIERIAALAIPPAWE